MFLAGVLTHRPVGTFLGIPYDVRLPSWQRLTERLWNPREPRLLTPKTFGWGWDVNFYQVLRRLRLAS
ncbi:MAG: hypothetical protein HY331_14225 [Chloroflexi bacterium]|nr:hypothetical protein [Chloroflexota bacterium]